MENAQEKFGNTVSNLPEAKELRRRALLFAAIDREINGSDSVDNFKINYNAKGSDRYYWEDGGGQEANIIFKADGDNEDAIVLFAYDHESAFNTYGDDSATSQIAFNGIPLEFSHLLTDLFLKWDWDKNEYDGEKLVYATTAIWRKHGDSNWKMSPTLLQEMDLAKETGGFEYAFKKFTIEPTINSLTTYYTELGYEEDMPDIEKIYTEVYLKN